MKTRFPARISVTASLSSALISLILGGCAAQNERFPSLATRPIEQSANQTDEPPAAIPVPAAADAVFVAKLDAMIAQAKKGQADFAAALSDTENKIVAAKGAAVSSEAWVIAQEALSQLDMARTPTATASNDLAALLLTLTEQSARDANTIGIPETLLAQQQVDVLYTAQNARLDQLRAGLE